MKRWLITATWATPASGRKTKSFTVEADSLFEAFEADMPAELQDVRVDHDTVTYLNLEVKRA